MSDNSNEKKKKPVAEEEKCKTVSSEEKAALYAELAAVLLANGGPPQLAQLWIVQTDICYSAYLCGKTAAIRLAKEGQIPEDSILEVAQSFARSLITKVHIQAEPAGQKLLLPDLSAAPQFQR